MDWRENSNENMCMQHFAEFRSEYEFWPLRNYSHLMWEVGVPNDHHHQQELSPSRESRTIVVVVQQSGNYFLLYPSKVFNSPHTPRDGVGEDGGDRRTPIKVTLLT